MYSIAHGERPSPADRRAEQARRGEPRAVARVGAPLRAPAPDALGRRPAPLRLRRRRARAADATAPRRRAGRRRGGRRSRCAPWSARKRRRRRCLPAALREELADALDRFDEPRAQAILDRLLAVATVDTLLSEVVLPYLRELGERWARGEASVAQEHFASSVLRGRLLGLARGWGLGIGPGGGARLPAGRAARPRPDRVRAGAARARLAHRLSRPRHADRDRRGGEPPPPTQPRRPDRGERRARAAARRTAARARRPPAPRARRRRRRRAAPWSPSGVLMLTGDPIAEATHVTALARGDASFDRQPTGT